MFFKFLWLFTDKKWRYGSEKTKQKSLGKTIFHVGFASLKASTEGSLAHSFFFEVLNFPHETLHPLPIIFFNHVILVSSDHIP
jgi:hypothetical protein